MNYAFIVYKLEGWEEIVPESFYDEITFVKIMFQTLLQQKKGSKSALVHVLVLPYTNEISVYFCKAVNF